MLNFENSRFGGLKRTADHWRSMAWNTCEHLLTFAMAVSLKPPWRKLVSQHAAAKSLGICIVQTKVTVLKMKKELEYVKLNLLLYIMFRCFNYPSAVAFPCPGVLKLVVFVKQGLCPFHTNFHLIYLHDWGWMICLRWYCFFKLFLRNFLFRIILK